MTNPKHTDTSRSGDLVASMKDQLESWEFEDPRESWWKWQHQYAQAADRIEALEAENERLRGLVQGWHYLAVGPDEMGDYYTHKQLIKASEPYAHPALRAISGKKQ